MPAPPTPPGARQTRAAASPGRPGVTPAAVPLSGALAESPALQSLTARLRASQARMEAIRPCLPAALAAHVRPGPIDEAGWSILVGNAGVAAKLRHLLPDLEAALQRSGLAVAAVRVRVSA